MADSGKPLLLPLVISRTTFQGLWCVVLAYASANAGFLIWLAWGYYDFLNPHSMLKSIAHSFFFSRPWAFLVKNHSIIASGYLLMALPNLYGICRLLWYTLRRKQLAFGPASRRRSGRSSTSMTAKPSLSRPLVQPILDFMDACGICGPWFMQFTLLTKSGEVALQILQGYRSSQYISNFLINQLYGAMAFVNCWSMPVILFLWRRKKNIVQGRLLCIVVDVVLGFTWGTVIQGCLFARYYSMIKAGHWPSAVPETYERELGRVLIISFPNFLFIIFPFVTSGWGIIKMVEVLAQEQFATVNITPTSSVGGKVSALSHEPTSKAPKMYVVSGSATENPNTVESTEPTPTGLPGESSKSESMDEAKKSAKSSRLCRNLTTSLVIAMMVLGALILIVSIGSGGVLWQLEDSSVKCLDQLYPWFTNKVSCVGRQISCTQFGINGTADEINAALGTISAYMLANLGLSDCPALEMTPRILDFQQLETLTLSNVTVTKWDADAAIAAPLFPQFQTLALHTVHFNSTPVGIVAKPLPSSFEWMYAQRMNADAFIDAVGHNWDMTVYFFCRACNLSSMPEVVHHMDVLQTLQLQNNSISVVPDDAFQNKPQLTFINLRSNPITELSTAVWKLFDQLLWLDIQLTQITTVPSFAAAAANSALKVYGYGTTLCPTTATATKTSAPPFWLLCAEQHSGW